MKKRNNKVKNCRNRIKKPYSRPVIKSDKSYEKLVFATACVPPKFPEEDCVLL
jgi:hypothetical protein